MFKAMMTAAAVLLTAGAAQANPDAAQQANEVAGVTVTPAQADSDMVSRYVREVSARTLNDQIARWSAPICPEASGLPPAANAAIKRRIVDLAGQTGLKVGDEGCHTNVVVIVADDSDKVAKLLVAERAEMFGAVGRRGPGEEERLRKFLESKHPVRAWHVARRVRADDGEPVAREAGVGTLSSQQQTRAFFPTRMRSLIRDEFTQMLILVDANRVSGVKLGALANYVAMAALAQIDPDADVGGTPSIVNLFRDQAAGRTPAGQLTSWDRAYLTALYESRADVRDQDGEIALLMGRAQTAPTNR